MAFGAEVGSDEPIRLREGSYRLRLESKPPQELQIGLAAEEGVTLSFERDGSVVSHRLESQPVEYTYCEDAVQVLPAKHESE